jgi:hypothetical protein
MVAVSENGLVPGHVAIVALGYWFIVRRAGWQDLELPERLLLVGSGIVYFPVTLFLMFYWPFAIVAAIYGVSL